MSTFKAKGLLQDKDPVYWSIYQKMFAVKGSEAVVELIAPLETIDDLKGALDTFAQSSEGSREYSKAELQRIGLERQYGTSVVFTGLIQSLNEQVGEKAKLDKLLANFVAIGRTNFQYTMESTGSDNFLSGRKSGGDCNTVVRTFKDIAEEYLGIPVDYKTSGDVGFKGRFTAPKATTIDGKTGNVNNGAFWLFDNHYWIEYSGEKYDVLFGKHGVDTSSWVAETGTSDNPSVFEDLLIYTTGKVFPIADRYTTK